jgi:Flp pilus assembly protein TadD
MTQSEEDDWEAAQEGAELIREGEHDLAVEKLEALSRAQPDNPYAHFFLGSARFEKGDFVGAMRAYLRTLDIAPNYVGAMVHLAHTLRMLGRHGEAIRLAHQILARTPGDADALYILGLAHYARGDNAQAERHLSQFLETRPELETALEVEGMLQVLRGDVVPLDEDKDDD